MNIPPAYLTKDGLCYLLLEEQKIGYEIGNLQLAIELAAEKIKFVEEKMNRMDDDSPEYDSLQNDKNDLEMMTSGFQDRISDLRNRPRPN